MRYNANDLACAGLQAYISFCWLIHDWEAWRARPSKQRSFCCCFLPAELAKSSNKRNILGGLHPQPARAGELASSITYLPTDSQGNYKCASILYLRSRNAYGASIHEEHRPVNRATTACEWIIGGS